MQKLKLTFFSFFFLVAWTASAQDDVIPTSPDLCYKYMETILLASERDDCKETMDMMKQKQKAGKWTPDLYAGLAELGNEMIKRKMKRYNFFKPLIDIIHVFGDDSGLASQHFSKWISISKQILLDQPDGKTQLFENYLDFSYKFWLTGNLYDPSKGSHKWRSESRVFDMKYEDKVLSIKYENTTLQCIHKSDSLEIKDAKGIYYPLEQKWKGAKGRVNWTADGAKDAYSLFNEFTIDAKTASFAAADATLFYNSVFKQPIEGFLTDRATRRSSHDCRYPRFESKSRNIKMDDIGDGVSYYGGFVMAGSSVKGYGDKKGLSTILIENNKGQLVVKAESVNFDILKGDRVLSEDAKVTIYLYREDGGLDSIFHPSISFLYSIVFRKLDLTRGEARTSRVPFEASLQDMDFQVASLSWLIDTDQMSLGDNKQDLEMSSKNYFDEALFEKYNNIMSINPLVKFAVYSQKLQEAQEITGAVRPETNPWDQEGPMTDEEYCRQQPEFCDENGKPFFNREGAVELDTAFLMEIGEWPPDPEDTKSDNDKTDEELGFASTDPRVISADELAALLDQRMEKINIMTSEEIEKAKKNPAFKIIARDQDYRDFMKGYPKIFKFGAMDVYNLLTVVPNPSFNLDNTLPLFLEMVKDGFVVYNADKQTITLRDKLFHYVSSVNTKKKDHDFDKIEIKSVPSRNNKKTSNATFDLKTGTIETYGVQEFMLSDSQMVIARPFNGEVKMLKGRDMDFNGVMSGGFCNFTGSHFHFKYDIFHVNMDSINFIDVFIYKRARHGEEAGVMAGRPKPERAVDQKGNLTTEREPVNSVIEGGSGVLLIDIPSNKSGRMKSEPIYPSFECIQKSRVYYDKRNRQGEGVYPRDSFYYELEPFTLDGMDELEPEQLVFEGKLYAADIFEPINEKLSVMYHDLSFGFETKTRGNDPNPIYIRGNKKGKGTFKGSMGISNEGLIGNGRLDYLGATIESEYIEFLPEEFRAEDVDSFNLRESKKDGVEFPRVKGQQVEISWAPYSDSMHIETVGTEQVPFEFFDSTGYTLSDGSLTLTPKGLLGRGVFEWEDARLESNPGGDFVFGRQSIYSPSAAVKINSQGVVGFAFENGNVDTKIDFEKQTGDFISKEQDLATDLPYNSYQTSLDQFHWNMATNHIFMDASDGKKGFFLATEQSQDSLIFEGKQADYDLNTGTLLIDGVEYIRVADAFVYPKGEHVEIKEQSYMTPLEDSKIIADTINQNHVIQRANIQVLSRSEFTANGYLEFNIEKYKDQEIKFDNVTSKQTEPGKFVTVGSGTVTDSADFHLDKRTKFKGEILLNSQSELLTFNGYAKISSKVLPEQDWFGIESKVDKRDVSIRYENPKNPAGDPMYVGLFLDMDTMDLYTSILAPKRHPGDRSIFSTVGVLKFDNEKEMYLFGDSARVLGTSEIGKLFTVSESNAKVFASGRFDFDKGFMTVPNAPSVLVDVVGDFTFFLNVKSDYLFETSMNLDFYLPDVLRDLMVSDLLSNEETIDKVLYASIKNEKLHQHIKNYIPDDKDFEKVWKKVQDDERLQMPNDFKHAFFFINNKLLWSTKTQSFITQGSRLQLASIGGKHVGQNVKGHIEILNDPARGDALTFYINSPNGDWYYFSYQSGFLKTVSSNADYNNAISSLKSKDRRVKTANGNYIEVIVGTPGEYSSFKNKASEAHGE